MNNLSFSEESKAPSQQLDFQTALEEANAHLEIPFSDSELKLIHIGYLTRKLLQNGDYIRALDEASRKLQQNLVE